jgi:YcaO-like protein with predicted kinase domain
MINPSNNWRKTTSEAALELIQKHHARFGLCRIADITSLDVLGFPIYIALRPRGKTLCVSAGKGLSHTDSIVSAGMESIEIDVAERVDPSEYFNANYSMLDREQRLPFEYIPFYVNSFFDKQSVVTWMSLHGLQSNQSFYYPASLVSLDKSYHSEPMSTFPWSSNGLASGLTVEDAVLSGLYEVIERDAWSCWEHQHRLYGMPFSALVEDTIPFSSTKKLIEKIKTAGLDLIINPLETDLGLPVYRCVLLNSNDPAGAISLGFGCHHRDEIALNRAITEAAQARAVYISGARDDIVTHSLMKSDNLDISLFKTYFLPVRFEATATDVEDVDAALSHLLQVFEDLGMHEPLVYIFKNSEPFSVVRVICPSLAPSGARKGLPVSLHPRYSHFQPTLKGISALFL